mmetsp:Transcript_27109/g.54291  ORF Transcript_27109/g.54291 Transcript_27109/m.54291 type:complete len:230 (+) Transcript_27109:75-764(+)
MSLFRAACALLSLAAAARAIMTPQPLSDADMEMLEECVKHTYVLIIDSQGTSKSVAGHDGPCAFTLVRKLFEDETDEDDDEAIEIMLVSQEAPVTMPMLESMLTVGKYHLETILDAREPKIPELPKPFLNDTLEGAGVPALVASAIDDFVEERAMAAMDLLKAADFVEFPELMELSAAKTSLLLRPLFTAKDFDKALDELIPERPGVGRQEEQEAGEGDDDMDEEVTAA